MFSIFCYKLCTGYILVWSLMWWWYLIVGDGVPVLLSQGSVPTSAPSSSLPNAAIETHSGLAVDGSEEEDEPPLLEHAIVALSYYSELKWAGICQRHPTKISVLGAQYVTINILIDTSTRTRLTAVWWWLDFLIRCGKRYRSETSFMIGWEWAQMSKLPGCPGKNPTSTNFDDSSEFIKMGSLKKQWFCFLLVEDYF